MISLSDILLRIIQLFDVEKTTGRHIDDQLAGSKKMIFSMEENMYFSFLVLICIGLNLNMDL